MYSLKNTYKPLDAVFPRRFLLFYKTKSTNRYQFGFNGQLKDNEIYGEGNAYTAEFWEYDPRSIRRWNRDPVIYSFESPYACFHNNPIQLIDPDGRAAVDHIDVEKNDDGTYKVVGGEANSDKNIYVVDKQGKQTGEVVGQMLTEYSFHWEDGTAVKGAIINLSDNSGETFFEEKIKDVGIVTYILTAKGSEPRDFKRINEPEGLSEEDKEKYYYRGMKFKGKIASARDVGNYSAGYVAASHHLSWDTARKGFDGEQTRQTIGMTETLLLFFFFDYLFKEGEPTQKAQRVGFDKGNSELRKNGGGRW